jgi:hypothetical protein
MHYDSYLLISAFRESDDPDAFELGCRAKRRVTAVTLYAGSVPRYGWQYGGAAARALSNWGGFGDLEIWRGFGGDLETAWRAESVVISTIVATCL